MGIRDVFRCSEQSARRKLPTEVGDSRCENPGDTDRGRFPEWIPRQRMR
jgi:hypothetical protein